MIERAAGYLAERIYLSIDDEVFNPKILKYGFLITINFLVVAGASLLIGAATDKLYETIVGMLCFVVLRSISGGYHLNSSTYCVVLSIFTMVVIPHIPLAEAGIVTLTLGSLVVFSIYAPSNLQNQSRISSKYYPALKLISVLMVAVSLFFQSSVIAMAVTIQALSLINLRRLTQ